MERVKIKEMSDFECQSKEVSKWKVQIIDLNSEKWPWAGREIIWSQLILVSVFDIGDERREGVCMGWLLEMAIQYEWVGLSDESTKAVNNKEKSSRWTRLDFWDDIFWMDWEYNRWKEEDFDVESWRSGSQSGKEVKWNYIIASRSHGYYPTHWYQLRERERDSQPCRSGFFSQSWYSITNWIQ